MRNGNNGNNPKAGSEIRVGPIKKLKDIKLIKGLLSDRPRDLALFILGINTNLRASDLLGLRVGQVKDLKPNETIEIREKKTGRMRRVTFNATCVNAIGQLLAVSDGVSSRFFNDDKLFVGQRGPLTVSTVSNMVKGWCREINLKGNYGSHTLRKTWGYHHRVTFGVDLPRLMICFNHRKQEQTLDYLCIQPEEIKEIYENEL